MKFYSILLFLGNSDSDSNMPAKEKTNDGENEVTEIILYIYICFLCLGNIKEFF